MALGITQNSTTVPGASFVKRATCVGDTSYPTGGYIVTASQLGYNSHIRRVFYPQPANIATAVGGSAVTIPTFNANGIMTSFALVFLTTAGAQVANATDVSAFTFYVATEGI